MKCDKAQELFSEHLESALERPMAVAFERHLAECPDCETEYSVFRMTWQMLETLPEVEPPVGFAYGVVAEVQARREAEQAAASWWRRTLRDLVASKVPTRAFAAAAAAVVLGAVVVSPVKNYVGASLGLNRVAEPAKTAKWNTVEPGMAWLESGLSFGLESSSSRSGWSVFKLLIKSQDATGKHVSVYIMEPGRPSFDSDGLAGARQIFEGDVTESGQVVPFVLGQSTDASGVATALVRWDHRNRSFAEVVFIPMRPSQGSAAPKGSVEIDKLGLYSALQEISGAFGAVILVNGDINRVIGDVTVTSGTVDDALYQLTNSTNLRWRSLGARVYMVERKIQ